MSTLRTLEDRYGGIRRQLVRLVEAIGDEDPSALQLITELRDVLDDGLGDAVHKMRHNGYSDGEIGLALGVSRSAVSHRWPGDGRYVGAAGRFRQNGSRP